MLNDFQKDLITAWLNSENVSNELKKELKEMPEDKKELAFSDLPIKFGTGGYRALVGPGNVFLNEITYKQLTVGYANFINKHQNLNNKEKTIIIASDNRKNFKLHTDAIASVLTSFGYTVLISKDYEPLPTPLLSYLIRKANAIGGINITASHNPKEYNGIKFFNANGSQLLPSEDEKLIALMPNAKDFLNQTFSIDQSKLAYIDEKLINQYFEDIKNDLGLTEAGEFKEKILFSAMHGTASKFMSKFLQSLEYNVIDYSLHNFIDSNFINAKSINPESFESFKELIAFADELNIKYIMATDPDADRLGFCYKKNDNWILLDGNRAGIIQSYYLLKRKYNSNKKPAIISTHVSTNYVDELVKEYDGIVYRTATGFKWIANKMNNLDENEQFIIGFEEAIGALDSTINREKDSFQVAGLLLEILKLNYNKGYDFSDILEQEIYPKYGYWYGCTISKIINKANWKELVEEYLKQLKTFPYNSIVSRNILSINYNQDGSCLEFNLENNSWIKFRISGTEPKFKIYFNLYNNMKSENDHSEITKNLENEVFDILEFLNRYLGLE